MSELVQYQQGRIFRAFRSDIEGLRDGILQDAAKIVRREEEASIRSGPGKFYRTGLGLRSFLEQFVPEGNKKTYKLWPTAFYMIFGEYGTGARGARTGTPAPVGYKYGTHEKGSMTARRFSRIAIGIARPQVDKMAKERVRRYALNATVS